MTADIQYRKQLERRIARKKRAVGDLEYEILNLESSLGELQGELELLEEELEEIIEEERLANEIPFPNPPYGTPLNQPPITRAIPYGAPLTEGWL